MREIICQGIEAAEQRLVYDRHPAAVVLGDALELVERPCTTRE